jgi:hypothetical protein
LAGCLDLPLRAQNDLLVAAGYAPVYPERSVDAPELAVAKQALDRFLHAHEPYPAIVVDGQYDIVEANDAFALLTGDVDADALQPRANTMRMFLHPRGLARELVDFEECSGRLLRCVRRRAVVTADPELEALYEELCAYPGVSLGDVRSAINGCDLLVPLRLRKATAELAFFTTISTFGTAVDITLAELSIEALYPADDRTASWLHRGRRSRLTSARTPYTVRETRSGNRG